MNPGAVWQTGLRGEVVVRGISIRGNDVHNLSKMSGQEKCFLVRNPKSRAAFIENRSRAIRLRPNILSKWQLQWS
jgi:hypothetical protein